MGDSHDQQAHLERLTRMFGEAPISRFLGHTLTHCRDGVAEVRLPFRPDFTQGLGVIHGGIITAVADTAGYFAAASVVTDGVATTVELKINFVAPARNQSLIGRGEVISRGRTLLICQLKVTDEQGQLIAVGQGTFYVRRDQPR